MKGWIDGSLTDQLGVIAVNKEKYKNRNKVTSIIITMKKKSLTTTLPPYTHASLYMRCVRACVHTHTHTHIYQSM